MQRNSLYKIHIDIPTNLWFHKGEDIRNSYLGEQICRIDIFVLFRE